MHIWFHFVQIQYRKCTKPKSYKIMQCPSVAQRKSLTWLGTNDRMTNQNTVHKMGFYFAPLTHSASYHPVCFL